MGYTKQYSVSGGSGTSALGFDYYLDAVAGSDANDGSTPEIAFASTAPLNAMGSHAGMKIAVRRGTRYRQQLSLVGAYITLAAYGDGDRPVFDASDLIPSGWTKTGGYTNVWQRTISLPGDTKVKGNCWNGETFLDQKTTIAAVDTAPGSCYVVDWTVTSTTLYIYSASDPNGGAWSYSARLYGVLVTGDNFTGYDIVTRRNGMQDGSTAIYGLNCALYRWRVEDGCRHALYAYPGALLVDVYGYRAKNDLEGGFGNLFVINHSKVTDKSYSSVRCTADAGGLSGVSGFQNHGALSDDLFTSVTHDDFTGIGLLQCFDVASANYAINGTRMVGCGAMLGFGRTGARAFVSGTKTGSTCTRVFDAQVLGGYFGIDNDYTITLLDAGAYRSNVGTVPFECESINERVTVLDSGLNGQLFRIGNGALTCKGLTLGPALASPVTTLVKAGFSGGAVRVIASGNVLPMGMSYDVNGTTYAFAAWQAAGYDSGTVVKGYLDSFSDSFGVADAYLENVANWTRIGGVANQAGVRSGKLSHLGGTQTLYATPAVTSGDMWASVAVAAIPASAVGFPVVVRGADQSNYIGARWNATQLQVYSCEAGAFSQLVNASVVLMVGDVVLIAVRGNRLWVYVNNVPVSVAAVIGATSLATNKRAGTVPRDVMDPAADNFMCGVV